MSETTTTPATKNPTAIRRVHFYTASPVECCDRCSQGIKYVALVTLKDGTAFKYGMDCINKILAGDTSLKGLFSKNAKLLKKYEEYLRILSLPVDELQAPISYYDRGIWIIADTEGKMISVNGHCLFHPTKINGDIVRRMDGSKTFDMRGVAPGLGCLEPMTAENWKIKHTAAIEADKKWLAEQIERLQGFLARIMNNAAAKQAVTA